MPNPVRRWMTRMIEMKMHGKWVMGLLVAAALGAAAFSGWWFFLRRPPLPEGLIQANGRIEGDRYLVAGKVPGCVAQLFAREGDTVGKGQLLVRLDDFQVRARVDQARQAVLALEMRRKSAETAVAVLREDFPLAVESAEAGLVQAESQVATARANEKQAGRDAARFRKLASSGTVDQQRHEQMELAWRTARNQVVAAEQARTAAAKRLEQARLGKRRILAQEEEAAALAAQRDQAKAALAEARSVLSDHSIQAPAAGVITTRLVDVGEVLAAGTPMLEIVDLDRLYLKVYIPEVAIGKVRRELPARVYTDAFPDQPFAATVRYIASQAQFTPKEVQTPDERVKLVYAVHLYLEDNPGHRLTPGLPADAVIRWQEEAPWARPRW